MALQKDKATRYGVTGNYHRIVGIGIDPKSGNASVGVALYKDKAARDGSKDPLEVASKVINGAKFQELASKVTAGGTIWEELATALYTHLKTLPEFAASTDV